MSETQLLIVAIELLRRQIADLKLSTIANATRGSSTIQPSEDDLAARMRAASQHFDFENPGGVHYPQPAGPMPKPKEAVKGFLESGWTELIRAVQSILGTMKAAKPNRVPGSKAFRRIGKAFRKPISKFKRSSTGRRLAKDFQTIKNVFGRAAAPIGAAAGGAAKVGSAALGGIEKLLGGMFGKLMLVLGPIALLASVIQSNLSGVQLVMSAFKLLGATLAPILLPIMILLATGLTELSDRIWNDLQPVLGEFYKFIINLLLPAVSALVDAFMVATAIFDSEARKRIAHEMGRDLSGERAAELEAERKRVMAIPSSQAEGAAIEAAERRGETAPEPTPYTGTPPTVGEKAAGKKAGGLGDQGGLLGGKATGTTRAALSDVLREFRMSVTPKASISGLTEVGKNIQLGALNQSPFEAKMLDRVLGVLNALDRIDANTRSRGPGGRYDTPKASVSGTTAEERFRAQREAGLD